MKNYEMITVKEYLNTVEKDENKYLVESIEKVLETMKSNKSKKTA